MEKFILEAKGIQIPLLFEYDSSLPVVNLKLVFKVAGSVSDTKSGISKLCAKILNEGTKELGSSEFARLLEIRAIEIQARSGFETLGIELNCLKEHFDYAFNMLVKMLKDPNLTESILDKTKKIIKSGIATNENQFDYLTQCELNRILHPNSPKANPLTGTYESIDSIELEDVEDFLKNHINLSNLYMVLAGDIELKKTDFSKLLYALDKGEKYTLPYIITSSEKNISEIKKDSEQAYIYFGSPFNVEKHEFFKANVASFILGAGGFGSRLMEEIRVKRGLAYSAYARTELGLSSKKLWGYLQTKNESKDEAIDIVRDEINKFIKNGVSKIELSSAKDFLIGSAPLAQETMFKRVGIKQDNFYNGFDFDEFEKRLNQVRNLTIQELNEFIKTHTEVENLSFAVLSK